MCNESLKTYADVADEMAARETECVLSGDTARAKVYSEIRAALIGQIKDKLQRSEAK
jgi:hypothetical protein